MSNRKYLLEKIRTNHVQSMTLLELAQVYGVSRRIMTNWLEPHTQRIEERIGHYYTPKQVRVIFDCIGLPTFDYDEE